MAINLDWLRARHGEGATIAELAAEASVSKATISRALAKAGIARRAGRSTIDPDWLRRRYEHDWAAVADIAAEAGVDPTAIWDALARHGIELRGRHDTTKASHGDSVDASQLQTLVEEGLSWSQIGQQLGISHSSAQWWAADHGLIDPKSLPAEAKRAARLYGRGGSLRSVANELGVDAHTVGLWLRVLGVPRRARGSNRR